MIATHTLAQPFPGEDRPVWHWLASGRSAALFAVLAGVSLVLMSRDRVPVRGLVVRALLIAALGLALGELESGLAVILTYYGVLFLLGLPFLRLPARRLFALAAVWTVVAPAAAYLLAPHLPERDWGVPRFDSLEDPGRLLADVLVTGYYPAITWLAYLLVGIGVGRLPLRRPGTDLRLLCWGLLLAVGAQLLAELLPPAENAADYHGSVPPTAGRVVLLVADPHSGTALDLATTTGSALAVVGLCLLVVRWLPRAGERGVAIVFGAGTMTLTLYSLHVLLHTPDRPPADHGTAAFREHVAVVLVIGAVFVALRRRGPLEHVVRRLT